MTLANMMGFCSESDKVDYVEAKLENQINGMQFNMYSKISNLDNKLEILNDTTTKDINDLYKKLNLMQTLISKMSFVDWVKLKIFNSQKVFQKLYDNCIHNSK